LWLTRPQLAWLNLTYSDGLSYNQVLANLGPGGEFAGFSYATDQQVLTLFQDANIPGNGFYPQASPVFQTISAFIPMIGDISGQNGYPGVIGIQRTPGYAGPGDSASIYCLYGNGVEGYRVASPDPTGFGNDQGIESVGSWLVMESVPEPETVVLLIVGGGLVMLHHRKFRKSSGPG